MFLFNYLRVVSFVFRGCNQPSSALFYPVFESLYQYINAIFDACKFSSSFFSWHIVCRPCLLLVGPYTWSIVFLFSGPFIKVFLWFTSRMVLSVIFWPSTRPQKMLFQGDAPEGSDTFQWPVIERDRVGGLRLIIWDKVKVPLCQYRLMHRKRVTSELHDSYFHLMTIKYSISKIQWALNYDLTQLSSSPRSSCHLGSR